jgi:Flp pilus assembly pilin Flp
MKKTSHHKKGQGIVEYILITALVALAAVAMFKAFREDVRTAYKKAGESLIQGVEESVTSEPGSNG